MARMRVGRNGGRRGFVTVGTDFSAGSRIAVERARSLAETTGSRLCVVHVVTQASMAPAMPIPSPYKSTIGPSAPARGGKALRAAVSLAARQLGDASGTRTSNVVRVGVAHRALSRTAQTRRAIVLVVGVRRPLSPSESFFLGSTAERALRDGPTPVLLARTRVAGPYRRALVALDLGFLSLRVAKLVAKLMPEAEYEVVHCLEPMRISAKAHAARRLEAMTRLRTLCAGAGMEPSRTRVHVVPGEPRKTLRAAIRTHGPEVVALATHARRGLSRMLIGSVADYLIHAAWTVDVLAVPPSP
jgi:universal stress protein E